MFAVTLQASLNNLLMKNVLHLLEKPNHLKGSECVGKIVQNIYRPD